MFIEAALAASMSGCQATAQAQAKAPTKLQVAASRYGEPFEAFYSERSGRPLWMTNGRLDGRARQLLTALQNCPTDGLDPASYQTRHIHSALVASMAGPLTDPCAAELACSRACAKYLGDLTAPNTRFAPIVTNAAAAPRAIEVRQALEEVAHARGVADHLASLRPDNPVARRLRSLHAQATSERDRALTALNLQRARALPGKFLGKIVIVDAASARLWLYDGDRLVRRMAVVVGKAQSPTPIMSGLIQYAVFNPYWNVPEDIAQDRYAPLAVREGAGAIDRLGFEVLSDWTAEAVVMPSHLVDWPAVAAGRASVRMRQKPGRDNMMGKVKLMLPNRLGIYLHDTPDKSVMARFQRALSAGCVRLADALGLAGDLLGETTPFNGAQPETRIDLPTAIPVHIGYFTLDIDPDGPALANSALADVYGRDPLALAEAASEQA